MYYDTATAANARNHAEEILDALETLVASIQDFDPDWDLTDELALINRIKG
jgi:hypothetical protein